MNELELWSDITGYEGLYQVSNLGNVKSLNRSMMVTQERYSKPRLMRRKGKLLKPGVSYYKGKASAYPVVLLCKNGIPKNHRVHRLVALHFVPNPENKPAVNHLNANTLDNRAANLEWCTITENNRHAIALGNRKYKNKPFLLPK